MVKILYITKGNADPKGKPRVYFTCHPEDFDRYFEKIKDDIFATHDCAIYYAEDMTEVFDETHLETDLGQMNLFVVPVTYRLLSQSNRAMDADIAYAKQAHIPILPFMMESGIDELYSKPEKFGPRQYINPNSSDDTEIRYQDKLKKHLESTLISDEMAQRVRAAFDAYIFLSYRKKDRKYANELMKLIHKNPECRDIAIWYDEFLTPGESFADSIQKALADSKLFALLVTPNLLEEPDGKPNYVMAEEYPAAVKAGKEILPAEMEKTDRAALEAKFRNIPDCADTKDEPVFQKQLLQAIQRVAITSNNNDPEHNFLIGLAYLEGIDVEVNKERGIELITSAANAELPEAMTKLMNVYYRGVDRVSDCEEAAKWAERLCTYYSQKYGKEHSNTLTSVSNLALICREMRNYGKELKARLYLYRTYVKIRGEAHLKTLEALHNLCVVYVNTDADTKALVLARKEYSLRCKVQGAEHPDTLRSIHHLANVYTTAGNHVKSAELYEKAYMLRRKVLGEEHTDTRNSLYHLALEHERLKNYQKAKEWYEIAYSIERKLFEENDDCNTCVLNAMEGICKLTGDLARAEAFHNKSRALLGFVGGFPFHSEVKEIIKAYALSLACEQLGEHEMAEKKRTKAFTLLHNLGENHPHTIEATYRMGIIHQKTGDLEKAVELKEKAHTLLRQVLADEHPNAIAAANALGHACTQDNNHTKAAELQEIAYTLQCKALGEEHEDTISILYSWASACRRTGNPRKETELYERYYALKCKTLGESHKSTLSALEGLASTYKRNGNHQKALQMREKLYALHCKTFGESHKDTLVSLSELADTYRQNKDYQKELALREKIYSVKAQQLGSEHPDTLRALRKLSSAYGAVDDYQKAIVLLEQWISLRSKTDGEENVSTYFESLLLSTYYTKISNYCQAIKILEHRQSCLTKMHSETAPASLLNTRKLVITYLEAGQIQKALELGEKSYALHCQALGEKHKDTFLTLHILAYIYGELGDHQKAAQLYEQVYALKCEVLGEMNENTLISLNNLACEYRDLGNREKAKELFEKLYALQCKVLGEEHEDTLRTENKLQKMSEQNEGENQ